jgi:hypothetical protein
LQLPSHFSNIESVLNRQIGVSAGNSGVNRLSSTAIANIHELLDRYQVHYEICPYYVVLEEQDAGTPPKPQRVQAGFDVNLYGNPKAEHLPLFHSEAAHTVLNYFESVAQEIRSRVGHHCTIEIIPCTNSLVSDPEQHSRLQGMLQIRISHDRGLQQPNGPSEDFALKAVQQLMHELGIRRVYPAPLTPRF